MNTRTITTAWTAGLLLALSFAACARTGGDGPGTTKEPPKTMTQDSASSSSGKTAEATFGAGCFWCVEAVFQRLEGVISVEPGYAGGDVANPTYEQVCTGTTGHAEVCRIVYDPEKVSFDTLLEVFWKTHDPTTLDRQGNDVGTQYRSAVFYHDEEQKKIAEKYKKELDASGAFDRPIVTEIVPLGKYYPAEKYHRNYFNRNPNQAYCSYVIVPKLEKFEKVFRDRLKKSPSGKN
jgi:peptide-methionine (S)-S-oxide reductase